MAMRRPKKRSSRKKLVIVLGIVLGSFALLIGGGALAFKLYYSHQFAAADGEPEPARWYGVYPAGAVNAEGGDYHGLYRIGSENNVLIYFNGGGVSVDDYTEQRSSNSGQAESFYNVSPDGDNLVHSGLTGDQDENPFRNWTVIVLPYSTGDFHAGAGAHEYLKQDGEAGTVHHNGFTNFDLVLDKIQPYLGDPDKLVISGSSAGGFGAALLSRHIADRFENTDNVSVVVDSSLLLYDKWHDVASEMWKSPATITNAIHSDNITLDSLQAMAEENPNAKILFTSSTRDEALVQYQSYLDGGPFRPSKKGGEEYQEELRNMIQQLKDTVPNLGVYIFEGAKDENTKLTQHTILLRALDAEVDDTAPADWIFQAVQGNVQSYGEELLQ